MRISLVTINYNGAENTLKLLKSLDKQSDQDFETYVVDNASAKEDLAKVVKYLTSKERVKLIENLENKGFSGGNNTGIHQALSDGADWVILINNDTWVKKNFITDIKDFISSQSGIVGIPTKESEDKIAYAGRIKWLSSTLPHIYHQRSAENGLNYAIGAAISIHKSVFEKIGYWDEKYFLYFEDADFSARARRQGIDISIAPTIIHHGLGQSTEKLGRSLRLHYHYRNAHLFNLKNGPWLVRFLLPIWSGWIIMKQIVKWIFIPHTRVVDQSIITGVLDFYLSKFGKII